MLDCHFVGRRVKSEKPLRPSSLSRPIDTVLPVELGVRWSAAPAGRDSDFRHPSPRTAQKTEQRAGVGSAAIFPVHPAIDHRSVDQGFLDGRSMQVRSGTGAGWLAEWGDLYVRRGGQAVPASGAALQ